MLAFEILPDKGYIFRKDRSMHEIYRTNSIWQIYDDLRIYGLGMSASVERYLIGDIYSSIFRDKSKLHE